MNSFVLKAALAGSIVVLSACPASAADNYLFGYSPYGVQTLTLNGSITLQAVDTGWVNDTGFHGSGNPNYFVGDCEFSCSQPGSYNDYFRFDLSRVGVGVPITSAVLSLGNGNGYAAGVLSTYSLFDVNSDLGSLDQDRGEGDAGGLALFSDFQSGILFGSRSITDVVQNSQVDITLNANALASLSAAVGNGGWAIGGTLRPGTVIPGGAVPEPASWAMMLAGFGAIGGAMRSRRKAAVRFG